MRFVCVSEDNTDVPASLRDVAAYLNDMLRHDRLAVTALLCRAVPCSESLANHPKGVTRVAFGQTALSGLGLLGGFFAHEGYRLVAELDASEVIHRFYAGEMVDEDPG